MSLNQHTDKAISLIGRFQRQSIQTLKSVTVEDLQISDYFLVTVETKMSRPRVPRKKIRSTNIQEIDMTAFHKDLVESKLKSPHPPPEVEPLTVLCSSTLSFLLDKYAPGTVKRVPDRPASTWYNSTIRGAKRARSTLC